METPTNSKDTVADDRWTTMKPRPGLPVTSGTSVHTKTSAEPLHATQKLTLPHLPQTSWSPAQTRRRATPAGSDGHEERRLSAGGPKAPNGQCVARWVGLVGPGGPLGPPMIKDRQLPK